MTDEQKNTQVQHECFCRKRFKDVLVVAIGTFVGVYCAMSLFCALHRPHFPQFMPYGAYQYGMYQQMEHFKRPPFGRHFRPDKFREDFKKFDGVNNGNDFKPENK